MRGAGTPTAVANGEALLSFADAVLGEDAAALASARERVRREMGEAALVDAAGIVGTFQQMDRIADATGIPLDAPMRMATRDVQDELGLDSFGSAANTPRSNAVQRLLGRIMVPLRPIIFRRLAARARHR